MIYAVLSVRDSALNAFGRPVFVAATGAGIRSFADEVNRVDAQNEMNKHPGDFELFELGTFDDSTGRFLLFETPKSVLTGRQALLKGESNV